MRVLVTDHGKSLMEILCEEHIIKNNKINLPDDYNQNKSTFKSKTHRSTIRSRNNLTTKASSARSINNSLENSFPKALEIKMKKLHISKIITEKYNNDNSNNNIILSLPGIIQKKLATTSTNSINISKQNFNDTIDMTNYQFSIKDILPQTTYKEFKEDLNRNKFLKDRNRKIDESMFRSDYKEKTDKEILEENMNAKIGSNYVNLIKYLNSRPNLNYQFVQKISGFDEDRLSKINKICQKVFDNNEKNELFNKIAKEKIKLKKRKDLSDYHDKLESLSKNLFKSSEINNEYKLPTNVRIHKYRDLHEDIKKKFWSKHSVEELSKIKSERKDTKETTSFNYFHN